MDSEDISDLLAALRLLRLQLLECPQEAVALLGHGAASTHPFRIGHREPMKLLQVFGKEILAKRYS